MTEYKEEEEGAFSPEISLPLVFLVSVALLSGIVFVWGILAGVGVIAVSFIALLLLLRFSCRTIE